MGQIAIIGLVVLGILLLIKSKSSAPGLSATEAKDMLAKGEVKLLDVRTSGEHNQGNIKGSKNIDVMNPSFKNRIEKLDKNDTYIVYCKSGMRSAKACSIMDKAGFSKIYNLKGGYMSY